MKKFKGLFVRAASNGCGYDYQDLNGRWNVMFTSALSASELVELELIFK